ncbi:MAG: TonB-dependent receptor [Porticoccaceae bacterium]|jgi:iron complex outermembrane receptor protein|nr:TonB-dependent receptor [Porticoccaceae bacterium]
MNIINLPNFKNQRFAASALALAVAGTAVVTSPMLYAESLALEEIIVTSRKREESLQDVPISVTSVTEELSRASVRSLRDMADFAPNLYIERNQGTPGGVNISMRGVEYSETDKSYDPSIGVVVDGMYLGTAAGSMLNNFDTKRIEILRGPQGTLFGKNTTGGVIHVVRGDVTGELGGKVSATVGSDGREDVQGVLNLPLGENGGVKLFANSISSDGYFYNTTLKEKVFGDDKTTFGAAIRWEPTEDFDIQLHVERNNDDTDSGAYANANTAGILTCSLSGIVPALGTGGCAATDTGSGPDQTSTDGRNDTITQADNIILTANWDLGPVLLTSITTRRDLEQDYMIHFDASAAEMLRFQYINQWEQTSQELRITSQYSDRMQFVAGLYYWEVDYSQRWRVFDLFSVVAPFPKNFYGYNGQDQVTDSTAVFFSLDYSLTDALTLTVGGRYTKEEKDFDGASSTYTPTDLSEADLAKKMTNFKADFNEFSPKVGLSFTPSDDTMIYGSYTEGFKSGGFFGRQANFNIDPSYEPEYVKTFELGAKRTLLDGRMTLNATLYKSEFEDKQESIFIPISNVNVATVVRNAASLDIQGVELEVLLQASESLKVRASYGHVDAEYNSYMADLTGSGIATDNSGLTPRNTPENTASLGLTHTSAFGDGTLQSNVTFRYRSEMEGDAQNKVLGLQSSITNLNANVSYIFGADGEYKVSVFGNNITDEREHIWRIIAPLVAYEQWNEGSTYGLQFDYRF